MSLQASNMFDRYFSVFESNSGRRQRFQVVLNSGKVINGVPVAAADATSAGTFSVIQDDGSIVEVTWKRLLVASQIAQLRPA